jgi:alpha-L-fucosidase
MKSLIISLTSLFVLLVGCTQKPLEFTMAKSEFIYEEAPFPQCHASTLVETEEGILASWFGGTHERNDDVCIYTSLLKNGAWSTPELVADGVINDTLRYPCWNPVLFKKDNGDIVLYYKVGPTPRDWWGLFKTSNDKGKTWSDAIEIPDSLLGPIKNKAERLSDGTILYPTSIELTPDNWKVYVEKSSQQLEGWRKIEIDNNGFNPIQPSILFHDNGNIQMLCRSREGKIVETWTSDEGETWSPVKATNLINNNSGIDAVTLKNGKHLLVCNPIEKGRNKLSLFLSEDGKAWEEIMILEDEPEGEFSYPAIIQAENGDVHISYTYNRVKVKYMHVTLN